jgi:hypothetical protein
MLRAHRHLIRELLPGIALPALIYFAVSRRADVITSLAAASSVPAMDALWRIIRRKPQSVVGAGVLAMTALSVGLAVWLHSPLFILVKGAMVTFFMGVAFAFSAAISRPLTRTLALRLTTQEGDHRLDLARRWGHPKALRVFRALSVGWGALLLLSAGQQVGLALTLKPGMVMALEGPMQAMATGIGILVSVMYVRRHHQTNPELALLPQRVRRV